jgi:hypothetical protein
LSRFTEVLLVSPLADGKTWVIGRPFGYDVGSEGSGETIEVPVGFQTDFASVPRPFWWLLPRWGRYGNAAVIHDYCYWEQRYTRKRADEIFREAMRVLQVRSWQVFLMYQAVRWFAGGAWAGNQKQAREGVQRVLPPPVKAGEARLW